MVDIGFNDIKEIFNKATEQGNQLESFNSDTGTFDTLQIGVGSRSFKIDEQGLWLGADQFENANFYVDMSGNVYMKASTGDSYLLLDSKNSKIVVNDGTEDVITIGKQADDSYGIDIANGKLEGAWIVADSITATQIAADTITATEIAADTITTTEIKAGTIEASDIKTNTITATQIAADTITTTEIKAGTIEASDIKTNTITATQIAAGAVDTDELAADAVTASKIDVIDLAAINADLGDVTAGILTVSGGASSYITIEKGGAANSNANLRFAGGSQIWSDTDDYLGLKSSGNKIYIYLGTTLYSLWETGSFNSYAISTVTRALYPENDDAYYLGNLTHRWDAVYAVNGTIQTSDRRDKTKIKSSDLGLEFVKSLNPIKYKWKETVDTKNQQEGGIKIGEKNKKRKVSRRKGIRDHYGLIAQDVEETLKGKDFAGLIIGENGRYGLRYSEFIAPMIKAIQELNNEIVKLKKVQA